MADDNSDNYFFRPFGDGSDVTGGSSTNYRIPPNAQFPPNTQFSPNFSTSQYPPKFSNFVGYPYNPYTPNFQNFQSPRWYMPQPEFWQPMVSQFRMQAPPHEFSPMSSNSSRKTSVDASASDKESTTLSFVPETQQSIDVKDVDVENFVDLDIELKKGKRNRTSWLVSEDEKIARAYVTISQDSVVGRGHKKDYFWARITKYYNETRPDRTVERDANKIKSHWHNTIHYPITRFNSIYNALFNAYQSGWSDENLLSNAYSKYMAETKKAFTFEHVWRIMKEETAYFAPQSDILHNAKKVKTSGSEGHTTTSVDVDETAERIRPLRQKAIKWKGKAKVETTTETVELDGKLSKMVDKMQQFNDAKKIEVEALKVIAEAKSLRAKAKTEKMHLESLAKDFEFLTKDLTGMTQEVCYMHQVASDQIKKKWRALGYELYVKSMCSQMMWKDT